MAMSIVTRHGTTRMHTLWFKRAKTSNQILQKHISFKFKIASAKLVHKSRKQRARKLVWIKKS